MTQSHAIVWQYFNKAYLADHHKALNIRLPHPSNSPRHPLPIGTLVATSSEPALLVVYPTNGKITYWESITGAASADLSRQKQQSVQGSVPGLMSAETVTKVTEAEPRGFVLTFSTGRLAHLTVSDPQGKPSINVQFLRDNGTQSGGVFGSLRSVFSSAGWRRDVVAVRGGISAQRGQRNMLIATAKGSIQIWDFNWNGTHTLVNEIDAKGEMLKALTEAADVFHDHDEHLFEVLDLTVVPIGGSSSELVKTIQNRDCKVMVLTALKGADSSRYAVVGLTLVDDSVIVDVVHPIACYKSSIPEESEFRPQLLVPEPLSTAYVLFEKSLVLVSLVEVEETPSSQLQMEAHTLPDPFQDAIDLRKTKPYRVIGCAAEPCDRTERGSSCVIMIYGFGLIRVSSLPVKEGQSASERATVTAKTKIEQAVFFGISQQDLFDFSPRPELAFSQEELEKAAVSISTSIMSSTSMYIPAIGPSMEQQLQRRANTLAELNKYLRRHYEHALSRLTKWRLLWDAEKMASARAIWRCYNTAISNPNKGVDERNLLTEIIEAMSEDFKTENQPEHRETDGVRHWFIHDLWRLEYVLPWAERMVEMLFEESVADVQEVDQATQARFVDEANDIQLAGLETAFKFREANVATYGLENEIMLDGVLQRGYEELPEIWTSTANIVDRVKTLTDVSRELTTLNEDADGGEGEPTPELVLKLAADNPRQVQICCQTYIERSRWLKSRTDAESKIAGEKLMNTHFAIRKNLFASLSDVGQPEMGMQLAEKYRDMEALVDIIDQELESPDSDDTVQIFKERISSYFVKFGRPWASAYFRKHLIGGKAVQILTGNADFKKYLTTFLRHQPAYAKLGWLNEIISEQNYLAAADELRIAQQQETNLWSRRIGLSMGKLSLLAAQSKDQIKGEVSTPAIREIDDSVAVLTVQEKLYSYVKQTIRDAIDEEAETDLVMQRYGVRAVEGKPILRETLKNYMRKMLAMETLPSEGLIDVLTLMDDENAHLDEEGMMEKRYFHALKILRLSSFEVTDPGRKDLLERFIWRRCMTQDNWEDINRTELKDDTQVGVETCATSLFITLREGYRTGLWDKQSPLPPSALIQAGTTVESLRTSSHYANMPDNAVELLARNLEAEAELLEHYMEKGRLEEWWKGVVEAAKAAARAEADEEGEENLKKRNAERDFDRRLSKMDKEAFGKGDDQESVDEQGDVIMG